jgi:hypothetical protein
LVKNRVKGAEAETSADDLEIEITLGESGCALTLSHSRAELMSMVATQNRQIH